MALKNKSSRSIKILMKFFSLCYIKNQLKEKGIVHCTSIGLKLLVELIDLITLPVRIKFWGCIASLKNRINKNSDTLFAFYDLNGSPATFDIVSFLVLADYMRNQKKCKNLHVFIIPGLDEGFRPNEIREYQRLSVDRKNADTAYMEWRVRNILVPACWLIPSCKGITVCTSRDEALAFEVSFVRHRFPVNYSVSYPTYNHHMADIVILEKNGIPHPSLYAPEQAKKFVKDWLVMHAKNRKIIVITLRESSYQLDRNSNLYNWGKFVKTLDTSIFCPVIIRDTEKVFESLPIGFENAIIFPEVCFNVELRSALNELCYLNMAVDCGTGVLCILNKKTKYISFKWGLTPDVKTHMKFLNIEPGTQPSICNPFQKWVWEDDTFEAINREFNEMVEKIADNEKIGIDVEMN